MDRAEYRLGSWLVRPALNEIESADGRVHLEPKAMQTLVVLMERAGDVVSKDEILARVWRDTFVSEGTVFRVIAELRKALGDAAAERQFIVTVPKRGYRLIVAPAPVQRSPAVQAVAADPTPPAIVIPAHRWWRAAAALGILLTLAVGGSRERFAGPSSRLMVPAEAREAMSVGEVWEHRVDCHAFERARAAYARAIAADHALFDARQNLFDTITAAAVMGCLDPSRARTELETSLAELARWPGHSSTIRRTATMSFWFGSNVTKARAEFARPPIAGIPDVNRAALLVAIGQADAGVGEARAALALEPAALGENWTLGMTLFLARRFGEATAQFERTLTLYEGSPIAGSLYAISALRAGRADDAIEAARRVAWRPGRAMDRFTAMPALVFAEAGRARDRDAFVATWEAAAASQSYVAPTARAIIALARHEIAAAHVALDQARRLHDPWTVMLPLDPTFDALRR